VLVVFEIVSLYARTDLDCDSPICASLHSWDDRHETLCPAM
jgi:hypothetical protein